MTDPAANIIYACPCGCGFRAPIQAFKSEHRQSATAAQIAKVRSAAKDYGLAELPGGFFWEADAAVLRGLTPSALRKQVAEHRNQMIFILRGNKRAYPVEEIALFF